MTLKNLILSALLLAGTAPTATAADYNNEKPISASRWRDYKRSSYYGLRFGLNVPTLHYKGTGGLAQTNPLPRFHVGVVYGNRLGNGLPFFFESGLYYTEKGTELEENGEFKLKKITMRYIEVPVILKYKIDTGVDDLTVQPLFGGFLAVGVGGQAKLYGTREKIDPFGKSRYKRFDAGLRVGCGVAYQNVYFEMGYDIGLFNIAGSDYTDYHFDNFDGRIRTGNFTMSIGVDF